MARAAGEGQNAPFGPYRSRSGLADAKINVTAVDAVCAGQGRYGALLWVKAPDVRKAAKALGVR